MNALILAAGLGTRLGPWTAERPKALVEVAGKTMLEHQIRHLAAAGFDRICINIHHFADKMEEFISCNGNFGIEGLEIMISDERDLLLDTGGGIRRALGLFSQRQDTAGQPVLIHNVDIFSDTDLKSLYMSHVESKADATLLVSERETSRYLYFNRCSRLKGWSNVKTGAVRSPYPDFDPGKCRRAAFQGIHVMSASMLEKLETVAEEKFSITDFYVDMAAKLKMQAVFTPADEWVDAGKPDQLPRAAEIVNAHYLI